jgi:hypothetical protein
MKFESLCKEEARSYDRARDQNTPLTYVSTKAMAHPPSRMMIFVYSGSCAETARNLCTAEDTYSLDTVFGPRFMMV